MKFFLIKTNLQYFYKSVVQLKGKKRILRSNLKNQMLSQAEKATEKLV